MIKRLLCLDHGIVFTYRISKSQKLKSLGSMELSPLDSVLIVQVVISSLLVKLDLVTEKFFNNILLGGVLN